MSSRLNSAVICEPTPPTGPEAPSPRTPRTPPAARRPRSRSRIVSCPDGATGTACCHTARSASRTPDTGTVPARAPPAAPSGPRSRPPPSRARQPQQRPAWLQRMTPNLLDQSIPASRLYPHHSRTSPSFPTSHTFLKRITCWNPVAHVNRSSLLPALAEARRHGHRRVERHGTLAGATATPAAPTVEFRAAPGRRRQGHG